MAIKILATADIHIGKQSSAVATHNRESLSTRSTWHSIIDWAIQHEVDVLALSGDIVDHDNRFFEAIGPLQAGFDRLAKAGIGVFIVAGNHDYDVLPQLIGSRRYPNVHFLGAKGTWEQRLFSKGEEQVRFAGWSFPGQHITRDPLQSWDLSIAADEIPTIGLVHGDVDIPLSRYAPMSSTGFLHKQVDLWVVGHIHKPQIIRDRDPKILYPGSPHALSPKEPGLHGPVLITVDSKNPPDVKWIPLSPVRYELLEIDVTGTNDVNALRSHIHDLVEKDAASRASSLDHVEFLIYHLVLSGMYPDLEELDTCLAPLRDADDLSGLSGMQLQVRQISVNVRPARADIESLAQQSSPAGILASSILALRKGESTEFLEAVIPEWKQQHRKLLQSPAFSELRPEAVATDTDAQAKQYIERECSRLLGELMNQQR